MSSINELSLTPPQKAALLRGGVTTIEELAEAKIERLTAIVGVGGTTAVSAKRLAREWLNQPPAEEKPVEKAPQWLPWTLAQVQLIIKLDRHTPSPDLDPAIRRVLCQYVAGKPRDEAFELARFDGTPERVIDDVRALLERAAFRQAMKL